MLQLKMFLLQVVGTCLMFASLSMGASPTIEPIPGGMTGEGVTTRYWDCSKQSCAWYENLPPQVTEPVRSCAVDGSSTISPHTHSICEDGQPAPLAYMCTDQTPWIVNETLSYGFAAVSFKGGDDNRRCCACFLLTFQSGSIKGKKHHLVQITNTGGPLGKNHFDISLPGGGVGNCPKSCNAQFNVPSGSWGDKVWGINEESECNELPQVLQSSCHWRWNFLEGVDNPDVTFEEVKCPKELTDITGCHYNY